MTLFEHKILAPASFNLTFFGVDKSCPGSGELLVYHSNSGLHICTGAGRLLEWYLAMSHNRQPSLGDRLEGNFHVEEAVFEFLKLLINRPLTVFKKGVVFSKFYRWKMPLKNWIPYHENASNDKESSGSSTSWNHSRNCWNFWFSFCLSAVRCCLVWSLNIWKWYMMLMTMMSCRWHTRLILSLI